MSYKLQSKPMTHAESVLLYPHGKTNFFPRSNPRAAEHSICSRDHGDEHHPVEPSVVNCGRDHGDEHHPKPRSHL